VADRARAIRNRVFAIVPASIAILIVAMLALGYWRETGPAVVVFFVSLAASFMGHRLLKRIAFTAWVFAFVAAAMYYPAAFGTWFGFDLKGLMVPLIQIIMFGMGTTLAVADFTRVFAMPWPVAIGMVLQFSVMPFAGLGLAAAFGFEPEVAAGVILIGSCPGGVASNVMTYLARGNVPLSVTMTACSTLVSPIVTPFYMKVLAGRLIPIDFLDMMFSILDMIIVPIVAGLAANKILFGRARWADRAAPLAAIALSSIFIAAAAGLLPGAFPGSLISLRGGIIIGFALVGVVALAKLVIETLLDGPEDWMTRALPIISMAGICFIIAIITSRSRDQLLTVGAALICAAMAHNSIGYILGYWGSRLVRLDETACRTIAIEVGLQNGGMASGLAMGVLKSAQAALAPAIFGPWMNISGSVLASWWHARPVRDGSAGPAAEFDGRSST